MKSILQTIRIVLLSVTSLVQIFFLISASDTVYAQVGNASPDNVANPSVTAQYKGGEDSIAAYLCTPSAPSDTTNDDFYTCVNRLYRFGIAIGGSVAVFLFVMAGYLYMTGEPKAIEQAKSIVTSTLIGLLLLLSTYLLLNQINPDLIKFKPLKLNIDESIKKAPSLPKSPKIPPATPTK